MVRARATPPFRSHYLLRRQCPWHWSSKGSLGKHFFYFFVQAEDGIRVLYVTGVQTCALPISTAVRRPPRQSPLRGGPAPPAPPRSEERRVGKESVDLGGRRIIKKKKKKK